MSTKDQILSSELHGEALLTARRPELQPLIDHLREVAQGRDDIRIECAGILAGSWFSSAGGASPPRHRALPRQHGLGLRPVRLLGVTGDMCGDPVDVDGEIIYEVGEDIAKRSASYPAQKPYVIKFSRLISTAMSSGMQSMARSKSPSPPSMTRPKITQAATLN